MRPDSPDPGHLLLITITVTGNGHSTTLKKTPRNREILPVPAARLRGYITFSEGILPVPTAACADYLTTPEGAIYSKLNSSLRGYGAA
jgi:hypothetical protein